MQALSQHDRRNLITAFLRDHGASSFAQILETRPALKAVLDGSSLTMMLAPSDAALIDLASRFSLSLEEFLADPRAEDLLLNHLSILPTQQVYPMFTAINGSLFGSGPQDLSELKVTANKIIDRVPVIIVNKAIFHEHQYPGLTLNLLGRDPLFLILQASEPQDVINSCMVNPTFVRLCRDPGTFRQLMQLHYPNYPVNRDARQQYTDMTVGNGYAYYAIFGREGAIQTRIPDDNFGHSAKVQFSARFKDRDLTPFPKPDRLIFVYGNGFDRDTSFWVPCYFFQETIYFYAQDLKSISVNKVDAAHYLVSRMDLSSFIRGMMKDSASYDDYQDFRAGRLSQDAIDNYLEEYGLPAGLDETTLFEILMEENVFMKNRDGYEGWGLVNIIIPRRP